MSNSDCEQCQDLRQIVEIRSPADLEKAIHVVRDNLQDATITESSYWPASEIQIRIAAFSDVSPRGPWEDVLIYYFQRPACKQMFKLSAETYHGSGGSWEPVPKENL